MLASLGLFVFTRTSIPYQNKSTQRSWRHKGSDRFGQIQSNQFTGADAETISISGVLHPEITGGLGYISILERMADTGRAWPYITGACDIKGLYVITALSYAESHTKANGSPRQIDFSMELKQVSDWDLLGDLASTALSRVRALL